MWDKMISQKDKVSKIINVNKAKKRKKTVKMFYY